MSIRSPPQAKCLVYLYTRHAAGSRSPVEKANRGRRPAPIQVQEDWSPHDLGPAAEFIPPAWTGGREVNSAVTAASHRPSHEDGYTRRESETLGDMLHYRPVRAGNVACPRAPLPERRGRAPRGGSGARGRKGLNWTDGQARSNLRPRT